VNISIVPRRGIAALTVVLTLGAGALTGCGSSSSTGGTTTGVAQVGATTFGPSCDRVPTSGLGSFNGMSAEPVATAAAANPMLSTLAGAIKRSGMADTLNTADGITVFAPSNSAFGKLPAGKLAAMLANRRLLRTVLDGHVMAGQLTPDQLVGTHDTLAGDTITITGTVPDLTVGSQGAKILCGDVHTANATVYIIDTVLSPGT
jgi:uncharacterized surface protein with fasciclin (FAS1) repeats